MTTEHHEVPDSGAILVFVLLADMLHTTFSELIALLSHGGKDPGAGIATLISFLLIVIIFFCPLVIVNLYYIIFESNDEMVGILSNIALLAARTAGASFYFYGDNINRIINRYKEELNCGPDCVENNRIASTICLGIALLFYQLVPPCLHKLAQVFGDKTKKWYSGLHMMVTVVKLDALYTAIAIMAQTEKFCSHSDRLISGIFIGFILFAGIILLVVYCIIYSYTLRKDNNAKDYFWVPWVAFIVLAICFPMYVLADNAQPIDCAFGCDLSASNQTINDMRCNSVGNGLFRFGFSLLTFIIILSISSVLFRGRESTEFKLPRVI